MNQQIKSNNKNNKKETDYLPIKLAFQANIFKYVEKKKRQLSVFAAIKAKQTADGDKHNSTSSNLINRNTDFNFYKPNQNHSIDSDMLLSARIKLIDRKPSQKGSILKRKAKGHKSTLSDWRMLYGQRDGIAQKHEMKNNSPDKMAVTDRLFYPFKKQSSSVLQKSCSKHNEKQHRIKDIGQNSSQKYFVSDQNFFHMYHRSVTPIASDLVQKKRIVKYLKQNKERRQSRHGLRLMNEGIFSELSRNDVGFVPYKYQSSASNSKLYQNIDQCIDAQAVKIPKILSYRPDSVSQNKQSHHQQIARWNKTHIERFIRLPRQKQAQQFKQKTQTSEELNPQQLYLEPSRQIGDKKHINLSELFSRTIDNNLSKREQISEIRLKLFKPRHNKIEKGIFNVKNIQSQNKFANFQYCLSSPQSRKGSLNMTKHSKGKWVK